MNADSFDLGGLDFAIEIMTDGLEPAMSHLRGRRAAVRDAYVGGRISRDDAYEKLFDPGLLLSAMHALGWSLSTASRNPSMRVPARKAKAFMADFGLHRARIPLSMSVSAHWLYVWPQRREMPVLSCEGPLRTANPEEKEAFFELAEALLVPVCSYFLGPPEGMPIPSATYSAQGEDPHITLLSSVTDPAPLLREADPVGKAFELGLTDGSTAILRIESAKPHPDGDGECAAYQIDYAARGWFPGYTEPYVQRSIEFSRVGCSVGYFEIRGTTEEITRDEAAHFCASSLFDAYARWSIARSQAVEEESRAMLDGLLDFAVD